MRFLIRVDADPTIGSGHFTRMIALAQILHDASHEVEFATAARNALCDAYLADEVLPAHQVPAAPNDDRRACVALARASGAEWVVLDGARFDEWYQRGLRSSGHRVLSVDDNAAGHFASDVVLNQNYGAEAFRYSTEPYTTRLLGVRYALLRREFRTTTPPVRARGKARNVLVTLGGTRQPGLLARILDAVLEGGGTDVSVKLVAGAFQSLDADVEEIARRAGGRVTVIERSRNMAETMRWADAAVTAAGSTMWELFHMRVPFLVVPLDEIQAAYIERLAADGLCVRTPLARDLGAPAAAARVRAFLGDQDLRGRILERSATLIDPARAWHELRALLVA